MNRYWAPVVLLGPVWRASCRLIEVAVDGGFVAAAEARAA